LRRHGFSGGSVFKRFGTNTLYSIKSYDDFIKRGCAALGRDNLTTKRDQ
jgi:hypothetical protein